MIFARSSASLIDPYRLQSTHHHSSIRLLPKRQRSVLCGLTKALFGSEPKGMAREGSFCPPYNTDRVLIPRDSQLDTSTSQITLYSSSLAMPHDGQCKCGEIKSTSPRPTPLKIFVLVRCNVDEQTKVQARTADMPLGVRSVSLVSSSRMRTSL
jgi:hypothetical protein